MFSEHIQLNLVSVVVSVFKCLAVMLILLVARGICWLVNMLFIAPLSDPLRFLPGPKAKRMESHFVQVLDPNVTPDTHREWVGKYGKTFRFHGFGSHDLRIMSFDTAVYTHVLNSPIYEKPWQTRSMLSKLLGSGIATMEGHQHKVQRRVMSPAFSSSSVSAMSSVFFNKAMELRDEWSNSLGASEDNAGIIDVAGWLTRAAFDVIGLCGFDYSFGALAAESGESLEDDHDEVYLAYRKMFKVIDKGLRPRGIVSLYFPIIDKLFPGPDEKLIASSHKTIRDVGRNIVAKKKAAIIADGKTNAQDISDKDLLSLMIKCNLSSDIESSARLTDSELLDQVASFLFGGADSPSLTMAWCLHMLAQNPDVQQHLREEVQEAFASTCIGDLSHSKSREGTPDSGFAEEFLPPVSDGEMEEVADTTSQDAESINIDKLSYLDAVVRETLRLNPPVHSTIRMATEDDWIPVSEDIPGYSEQGRVRIRKGSYIHVPIEGLNHDTEVWGDDAREFRPDRWLSSEHAGLPGLQNVMTFSMGPHSCPGAKFTMREVKSFLAVLLYNFSFEPAPDVTIKKFNAILTKPVVDGQWNKGTRLPLRVKRL